MTSTTVNDITHVAPPPEEAISSTRYDVGVSQSLGTISQLDLEECGISDQSDNSFPFGPESPRSSAWAPEKIDGNPHFFLRSPEGSVSAKETSTQTEVKRGEVVELEHPSNISRLSLWVKHASAKYSQVIKMCEDKEHRPAEWDGDECVFVVKERNILKSETEEGHLTSTMDNPSGGVTKLIFYVLGSCKKNRGGKEDARKWLLCIEATTAEGTLTAELPFQTVVKLRKTEPKKAQKRAAASTPQRVNKKECGDKEKLLELFGLQKRRQLERQLERQWGEEITAFRRKLDKMPPEAVTFEIKYIDQNM